MTDPGASAPGRPGGPVPRYRFGDFVLSPRRRALLKSGIEQPLIPRYFDLLLFLIERRGEAVHRRDIFDRVWTDVVVSDSALSQAIRTIRRVLGDESRDPRFVRTVSRHGYEFVFVPVVEEHEAETANESAHAAESPSASSPPPPEIAPAAVPTPAPALAEPDPLDSLLRVLTSDEADDDQRREAAERLHGIGTRRALGRLGTAPGHARARAVLRDARWEVAEADAVPILRQPQPVLVAWHLVRLRARTFSNLATRRWAAGSAGGGTAGAAAGVLGGLLLALAPGSTVPFTVAPVLALVGAGAGALGGAGVGAGLSLAETIMRSRRSVALIAGAALGGALVGLATQVLANWTLAALTGLTIRVGGGLEGLAIGVAAGLGYAAGRSGHEGLAAPRGRARLRLAAATALSCGLAGLLLSAAGRPLIGGTVHRLASGGGHAVLTPLGRWIGEPGFGPLTSALLSVAEGATFGFGLAFGLTRRPPLP